MGKGGEAEVEGSVVMGVVEFGIGGCSIGDGVAGSSQSSTGRSEFITGGETETELSSPGN